MRAHRGNRNSRAGAVTYQGAALAEILVSGGLCTDALWTVSPFRQVLVRLELAQASALTVICNEDFAGDKSGHPFGEGQHPVRHRLECCGAFFDESRARSTTTTMGACMRSPWLLHRASGESQRSNVNSGRSGPRLSGRAQRHADRSPAGSRILYLS